MRAAFLAVLPALAACGGFGHVNQGQVVAYQAAEGLVTLISDSNFRDPAHPRFDVLPPVAIRVPQDPREMGPEPAPGKLLLLDCAHRRAVIFDAGSQALRTVPCTLIAERTPVLSGDSRVLKATSAPLDRATGAITVYSARQRKLMVFSVPPEFRDLPPDSWRFGDEIRYYYKDPGRALRLMNVSKTDLSRAGN